MHEYLLMYVSARLQNNMRLMLNMRMFKKTRGVFWSIEPDNYSLYEMFEIIFVS